jgi:hypothetical protein
MNINNCLIPTQYCGDITNPLPTKNIRENIKYTKRGTPSSCMKKGVGVGIHIEKKNNLSSLSLQQIKYVGQHYEDKFKRNRINTIIDLIKYIKTHSKEHNERLLKNVVKMRNNSVDYKAYNSIIHYLYFSNEVSLSKIPFCKKIIQ